MELSEGGGDRGWSRDQQSSLAGLGVSMWLPTATTCVSKTALVETIEGEEKRSPGLGAEEIQPPRRGR